MSKFTVNVSQRIEELPSDESEEEDPLAPVTDDEDEDDDPTFYVNSAASSAARAATAAASAANAATAAAAAASATMRGRKRNSSGSSTGMLSERIQALGPDHVAKTEEEQCLVCETNEKCVQLVPCGCMKTCTKCTLAMMAKNTRCVVCFEMFSGVLRGRLTGESRDT